MIAGHGCHTGQPAGFVIGQPAAAGWTGWLYVYLYSYLGIYFLDPIRSIFKSVSFPAGPPLLELPKTAKNDATSSLLFPLCLPGNGSVFCSTHWILIFLYAVSKGFPTLQNPPKNELKSY